MEDVLFTISVGTGIGPRDRPGNSTSEGVIEDRALSRGALGKNLRPSIRDGGVMQL
jgi:hypothetical protein